MALVPLLDRLRLCAVPATEFDRYDANGVFVGAQQIRAALLLGASGNEFTTRSVIEVFDANNNLIATGCATAVGTRFARRFE